MLENEDTFGAGHFLIMMKNQHMQLFFYKYFIKIVSPDAKAGEKDTQ